MLEYDNQYTGDATALRGEIHRGHKEARRALHQWLNYIRVRKNQVIKDWAACERCDASRLPLGEQIQRGDFGDNVVSLKSTPPTLDSMDQVPVTSYSFRVDNDDIKSVIAEINKVVRDYFYVPATAITYVEFCSYLDEIKQKIDKQASDNAATSIYERDRDLADCHYAFIHAGMGKLTGDVETGLSDVSPESLEMAVAMLASLCNKSNQYYAQKLQVAHTAAQNLQANLSGKSSLPNPTNF